MFEKLEMTRMAQALAAYSGSRMSVVARNVANADTPGFRAQDLPDFSRVYGGDAFAPRATRAGHQHAGAASEFTEIARLSQSEPNGNSVSLDIEMMKSAEIRQAHEMALTIYRTASSISRASLGRGNG